MKNISCGSIIAVHLLAVACTGIFTDRELPSLDARTEVYTDGADDGTEADADIGGEEICVEPFLMCGGECIDLRTDRRNCGTCGNACDTLASCVDGACRCAGGWTDCGGVCVDTNTDNHNCGRCGNDCGAGQVCNGAGICTTECGSGYTLCDPGSGAYCADTQDDPLNCGDCHNACGPYDHARSVCSAAACGMECDSGYGNPDGQIDNGCECTVMSSTETCDGLDNDCNGLIDDTFTCALGSQEDCTPTGTACLGTRACGAECAWGECLAACSAGMTCCPSGCVDLSADPENCGACGFSCSGHGTCTGGSCACSEGFDGPHCDRCTRLYIGYPYCHYDTPTGSSCQCQVTDRPDLEMCGYKDCAVVSGTVDGCEGCGGSENRCCQCRNCTSYPMPLMECPDAWCSCRLEMGDCL